MRAALHPIQSAFCPHPDNAVRIFIQSKDCVATKACRIFGVMPVVNGSSFIPVKEVQPASLSAYPKAIALIFQERSNILNTDAGLIVWVVFKPGKAPGRSIITT